MQILVNGKQKCLNTPNNEVTLSETIKFLGYKPSTIIVELNGLIINSNGWKERHLKDNDKLEIVSIVGGG